MLIAGADLDDGKVTGPAWSIAGSMVGSAKGRGDANACRARTFPAHPSEVTMVKAQGWETCKYEWQVRDAHFDPPKKLAHCQPCSRLVRLPIWPAAQTQLAVGGGHDGDVNQLQLQFNAFHV